MRVGKTAVYGLFAVLHVAKMSGDSPVQGRDIAQACGIPGEYLLKILQALVRGGVLTSARGRAGGFRLSGPPHGITVAHIVQLLEPHDDIRSVLQQSVAGHDGVKTLLAGLHARGVRSMRSTFEQVTVQQLLDVDQEFGHNT